MPSSGATLGLPMPIVTTSFLHPLALPRSDELTAERGKYLHLSELAILVMARAHTPTLHLRLLTSTTTIIRCHGVIVAPSLCNFCMTI